MKNKHTEGEWLATYRDVISMPTQIKIAKIDFTKPDINSVESIQEMRANVKLISAAPDLLDIVKKISAMQGRSWKKLKKDTLGYQWAIEMEEAIKKATL